MVIKKIAQDTTQFFNNNKLKKILRIGNDVFIAGQIFTKSPTFLNGIAAAFAIGNSLAINIETFTDEYFQDWECVFSSDFSGLMLRSFEKHSRTTIKLLDSNCTVKIIDIDGIKIGYIASSSTNLPISGLYAEMENVQLTKDKILFEFWNLHKKKKHLVIKCNKNNEKQTQVLDIDEDDTFCAVSSTKAAELSIYIKKCLDVNVNRSMLFHGSPGTGKSTLARTIVQNLDMNSIRLRLEDIENMNNSTITELIKMLKPDAIIFDDLDRSTRQEVLLETLEYFQRHVPLIIATANNRRNIDEAILRPGRFDELHFIDKLDETVVSSMLGESEQDMLETVKEWPVAFILEYLKRRKFMTKEEAVETTKDLAKRVERLKEYIDTDDIDQMLKTPPAKIRKTKKFNTRNRVKYQLLLKS